MIVVNNRKELKKLISQRIKTLGPSCDLNDLDVSRIKDMSFLFYKSTIQRRYFEMECE